MYVTLGMLKGGAGGGGDGGGSAYPAILDVVQTIITSGTSRNVVLPPTIAAGQMILITALHLNTSINTIPSGFTAAGSNNLCYKLATGAEGGTSVTFTVGTSSSGLSHFLAMVIGPVHSTTPPESSFTSSSDDPPSVTATWGAANNLSIAVLMNAGSSGSITAYPTNCPLYRETFATTSYDAAIAAAETPLATFDPGTFTATLNVQTARNIMVRGT